MRERRPRKVLQGRSPNCSHMIRDKPDDAPHSLPDVNLNLPPTHPLPRPPPPGTYLQRRQLHDGFGDLPRGKEGGGVGGGGGGGGGVCMMDVDGQG